MTIVIDSGLNRKAPGLPPIPTVTVVTPAVGVPQAVFERVEVEDLLEVLVREVELVVVVDEAEEVEVEVELGVEEVCVEEKVVEETGADEVELEELDWLEVVVVGELVVPDGAPAARK